MKIVIDGYPAHLQFEIGEDPLPRFQYGCRVRTAILHEVLKNADALRLNHAIEEYLVEMVENTEGGEIWRVGS